MLLLEHKESYITDMSDGVQNIHISLRSEIVLQVTRGN